MYPVNILRLFMNGFPKSRPLLVCMIVCRSTHDWVVATTSVLDPTGLTANKDLIIFIIQINFTYPYIINA